MNNSRRYVLFGLTTAALFGGLFTGREIFFTMTYLFGFVLIFSFLWAWAGLRWVKFSRVTRTRRAYVGQMLEERFKVNNTSFVPKLWLEVRDFSTVPGHRPSYVINGLRPYGLSTWRTQTICRKRGIYQLGPMELRTSDPFGLFVMEKAIDVSTTVEVYPLVVDVYDFALPQGILPGGDAVRRRTHYVTTNAAGIRDYAPGDSYNRIHWKSSARRDRLLVKEFELDPLADIWIVTDLSRYEHVAADDGRHGRRPDYETNAGTLMAALNREPVTLTPATEEYAVTVSASLASFFLKKDRSVGFLSQGQTKSVIQPDRGERQRNRILGQLAMLRAEGILYLEDLIRTELHLFPRGSTIIAVTATTRTEWAAAARMLKQRGMRVVTVLVDPASFNGRKSADDLYPLLHATGMSAYQVANGDDLTAVLSGARK